MKQILAFALMLCVALGLTSIAAAQDATVAAVSAYAQTPDEICQSASTDAPATLKFTKPEQVVQPGVDYRAIFCTDVGPIYVDLLENYSPIAVNSFVFLAQKGYFNSTTFHRVLKDFMAQGGDPTGIGAGDPGYAFGNENTGFLHFDKPGWLGMGNSGQPNSNGSQFFITTAPFQSGDFRYTIFGEVLEGQPNANAIKLRDPASATEPGTGLKTVVIIDDPSTVKTTYEAPKQPTEQDVLAAFENLDAQIPAEAGVTNDTKSQSTAEVVAAAPASIQDKYAEFLKAHSHQYRVSSTLKVCDLTKIPFMSVGYTIDSFPTVEDATAALNDPFLTNLETANGLTDTSSTPMLSHTLYTATTTACDTPAIHGTTFWQRGRFLITADSVTPADSQASPDQWLSQIVGVSVFEYAISDLLRTQIR